MAIRRRITSADLAGLPGLRRAAADALVARQPATVVEALAIADVGLKTTKYLLRSGFISDPEGVQPGPPGNRKRSRSVAHGSHGRAAPESSF
jgi:hypothetical protein